MFRQAMVAALVLASAGCALVFPAHPRSEDVRGENVVVRMLDKQAFVDRLCQRGVWDAMRPRYRHGRFLPPAPTPGPRIPVAAAPLVAAGVGFAVDYVQARLEEEAERYEAQFGIRIAADGFWEPGAEHWTPYWHAIQVVRTTADHGSDEPAFELILDFWPSMDRRAFILRPVYFQLNAARAKVLARRWFAPWTFLPWLRANDEVSATVAMQVDALWVDERQATHVDRLAAFPISLTGYDLERPRVLLGGFATPNTPDAERTRHAVPSEPLEERCRHQPPPPLPAELLDWTQLDAKQVGWFAAVPRSEPPPRLPNAGPGLGTFWVQAEVTERDPSNAKNVVLRSATELKNRRDDIVAAATPTSTTTTTTQPARRRPR